MRITRLKNMGRPRIGIDLHTLEGLHQGSKTHCMELFSRVIRLLPDMDFVCLADQTKLHEDVIAAFSGPNARIAQMPHRNPLIRLGWQLPNFAKRESLDLLHTQYVCPMWSSATNAVTIHDVLFEEYPQYFKPSFRIRSQILFRYAARRSSLVFTVSEYSKREMSKHYGIPLDRITTLYNGADSERFRPSTTEVAEVTNESLAQKDYLLTVGRLEPRKNHIGLLEAMALLPKPRPRLIIVGQPDFQFEHIFEHRDRLGLQNDVVFKQSVDENELALLYRHAQIFVYPTFAEGFGMPVIEAMSSGVPVITSNTTSLPEIAGDAALLIDPNRPEEIRDAIQTLLGNWQLKDKLRDMGLSRAKAFDWNRSAEILARCYSEYFSRCQEETF